MTLKIEIIEADVACEGCRKHARGKLWSITGAGGQLCRLCALCLAQLRSQTPDAAYLKRYIRELE